MYSIIIYTAHIMLCLCTGVILLCYKGSEHRASTSYYAFLRTLALLIMSGVPTDIVSMYLFSTGRDNGCLFYFVIPALVIGQVGAIFRLFDLRMHVPSIVLKRQHVAFHVYLVMALTHPLLYTLYRMHNGTNMSLTDYANFCQTDLCTISSRVILAAGVVFLAFCVYNTYRMVMYFNRVKTLKFNGTDFKWVAVICSALICVLSTMAIIKQADDDDYHIDLIVWSIVIICATIVELNTKSKYIKQEKDALKIRYQFLIDEQMETERHSVDVSEIKDLHARERRVVIRTMMEWSQRSNKPYMRHGITIKDVAKDTKLPMGVIRKYGNILFEIDFFDFIRVEKIRGGEKPIR